MAKKKYSNYIHDSVTGKWYGIDKYGVEREIKNPPKSVKARRSYTTNKSFHAGWEFVPSRYKHSFPNGVVENKNNRYRIAHQFKKGQLKNQPFSGLAAKKTGVGIIKGSLFAKHVMLIAEKLSVNAQNFTIILSLRAKKIFQDSFKYKKFYSSGSDKWTNLNPKTINKRRRRRTWPGAGGMLAEYGNMFDSIDTTPINNSSGITTGMRVFTDPKKYRPHTHMGTRKFKRGRVSVMRRFCYAGLHNEGGYIRGGHKLPRRQFMGHSTYLFDFAKQEMNKYLFYNVFD